MFKLCLLLIILFILSFGFAQPAANRAWVFAYFKGNGTDGLHLAYSTNGYQWKALKGDSSFLKPAAGKDKLMRDPCIIRGANGTFHMVWTVSWGERTIGYASSNDMVNWSEQQAITVMPDTTTLNAWAPEIFYDSNTKNYMIYWASTIPGKFPWAGMDSTKGKYNHRMYYVLTKDFKTFTNTKVLYDKGFSVIDATIHKDGNKYMMFLKNENDAPVEKNLRIATSKSFDKDYSEPTAPITGNYWAEGPTVLRNNGKWIVYFDKYRDHKYGAIESTDLKNWTEVSDKISLPSGIRHGTILEITAAELAALK